MRSGLVTESKDDRKDYMNPKRVKVSYFYLIRDHNGMVHEEFDFFKETLLELLEEIFEKHEENRLRATCWDAQQNNLAPGIAIFVNRQKVMDLAYKLKGGDEILLTTLLSGG